MNWRYRDNPTASYETVTARRQGRLVGYAVCTLDASGGTLVDLFGRQERGILTVLAHAVATVVRQRGVASLSVSLFDAHPWVKLFGRLGFLRREASPVVLSAAPSSTMEKAAEAGLFLMAGDRDS